MSGPGRPPDSMGGATVPIGDVVTRRSRHPVSREGEVRNLGQEEPHAVTYASVQELMEAVLESGERRVSFAAVMRALAKGESEQVAVVLTEDRLLVASVAWPSDYELTEALDRDVCTVLGHEDRDDGTSRLMIGHPDGMIKLEFAVEWRKEAFVIREALSKRSAQEPLIRPSSEDSLRSALGQVWRDRLLELPSSSEEAEGARFMYEAIHGSARSAELDDDVFAELHGLSAAEATDAD